ncbi:o-succinylbenzoic acid (OSB) synthetase [Oceanisphaera pacifica]|uniref:O-succinylbenzoic acid (OSB) synthetase n=1 Tax=Oceanisphaera pacifica TaxID=2818389 RepID=A0ABS3NG61_9GAMM|nr:o-succinylbenzoic acid (OSB) synthetase [Oceanisphaera pacifica]MBO1519561.1 o-succinylbenzoic acid (OSB) synthetase [Oceanisphaera pacifica]
MQITTYRYQLPLTMTRVIDNTTLVQRTGFYINIDGFWGEIAPPPAASAESLLAIEEDLRLACQRLRNGLPHRATTAAVQFGIDCALAQVSSALSNNEDSASTLPLLEGPRDPIVRAWRCRRIQPNRACLTLTGDVQYDAGLVRELCLLAPYVRLVLDAGGHLTAEQLLGLWQRVDRQRIDWLLDPASDMATGQHLAQQYQMPVAFDLVRYANDTKSIRLPAPFAELNAVVLRPAQIGGLNDCQQLVTHAHRQGLEVIIGDSLQTRLGQQQLARLSQAWNPGVEAALGRCRYLLDTQVNDLGQPDITQLTPV